MPQRRGYYGWVIAAASAVGIAGSVSVFIPSTMSLLVGPLGREFHWSPPGMFLAITFAGLTTVLVGPFIGKLVDRFGARYMILASFALEAMVLYSFRYLGPDISAFYLRYALLAGLASGTTALTFSALLARWFDRRRGLALGIGLSGLGFGGAFWSLITQRLITTVGWRDTFPYLAAIIAFVVLPILLICIRETPASMGLHVDGDTADEAAAARKASAKPSGELAGVTLRQAAGTATYWQVLLCFFAMSSAIYGVTLNIVSLLGQRGFSPAAAAAVQASTWLALVFGRVSAGWLMDRFFAPRVAAAFMVPSMIGLAMLILGHGQTMAYAGAALVGLASGAEVDVLAFLTSRYFGLRHYGTIYATFFSAYALGTSAGPLFTSWLAGTAGNYSMPLWLMAGLMAASATALFFFKRFPSISELRTQ
jgi:MFS family permease